MAGQSFTAIADGSTNAGFRAWGLAVSNALTALGFTKTTDTGQIDWATVTVSASFNQTWGYEIRQFTDSLQSTRPIYFKIEYGTGTSTVSNISIWITFGTATNGSGSLAAHASWPGSVSSRVQIGNTISGSGLCVLGSADGSALMAGLFLSQQSSSNAGLGFYIERHRNNDGTPSNEGFCFGYFANSTAQWAQITYTTATQGISFSGFPTLMIPSSTHITSIANGATLYPVPVFTGYTPRIGAPSMVVASVKPSDFNMGAQFAMTHYGVSRTFVAFGPGGASGGYGPVGSGMPVSSSGSWIMRID
jgi:hypothetical protein